MDDTQHDENTAYEAEREHQQSEAQRRRLWPRAAIVGALSGLLAVAFRAAANMGDEARNHLIAFAWHFGPVGYQCQNK